MGICCPTAASEARLRAFWPESLRFQRGGFLGEGLFASAKFRVGAVAADVVPIGDTGYGEARLVIEFHLFEAAAGSLASRMDFAGALSRMRSICFFRPSKEGAMREAANTQPGLHIIRHAPHSIRSHLGSPLRYLPSTSCFLLCLQTVKALTVAFLFKEDGRRLA